jgi:predicted outer membrane repeat protein
MWTSGRPWWVIFDECAFTNNKATKGSGGAVFSLGRAVQVEPRLTPS